MQHLSIEPRLTTSIQKKGEEYSVAVRTKYELKDGESDTKVQYLYLFNNGILVDIFLG